MKSVTLKCKNCKKLKHTLTDNKYYHVDCDCTLQATGAKFRTTNLPSELNQPANNQTL